MTFPLLPRLFFMFLHFLALVNAAHAGPARPYKPLASSTSALITSSPYPTRHLHIIFPIREAPASMYTTGRGVPIACNETKERAASTPPEEIHWWPESFTQKRKSSHSSPHIHTPRQTLTDSTDDQESTHHKNACVSENGIVHPKSSIDIIPPDDETKDLLRDISQRLNAWSNKNVTDTPPAYHENTQTLGENTNDDFDDDAIAITVTKAYAKRHPATVLQFEQHFRVTTGEYYKQAEHPRFIDLHLDELSFDESDCYRIVFRPTLEYNQFNIFQSTEKGKSLIFCDQFFK